MIPTVSVPGSKGLRSSFLVIGLGVFALLLLLTGCGEKKRAKTTLPPPPTISAPEARKTPPAEPEESNPEGVDANGKAIWSQVGIASWYGPPYHNRRGANGEIFDTNAMTAAHKTLPMNSIVRVTNIKTQKSAIVRITDRGPFIGDRIIDLSLAAAKELDVWRPGTARVRVDVLEAPAPIETGGRWCVQVGAFTKQNEAIDLKEKLLRRYSTSKVIEFAGPTGYWVRIRPAADDKARAEEISRFISVEEGGVFLVRLD